MNGIGRDSAPGWRLGLGDFRKMMALIPLDLANIVNSDELLQELQFLVTSIFYPEGPHMKIFFPARPTQGLELTFYEACL
jgi:hypothetical protein